MPVFACLIKSASKTSSLKFSLQETASLEECARSTFVAFSSCPPTYAYVHSFSRCEFTHSGSAAPSIRVPLFCLRYREFCITPFYSVCHFSQSASERASDMAVETFDGSRYVAEKMQKSKTFPARIQSLLLLSIPETGVLSKHVREGGRAAEKPRCSQSVRRPAAGSFPGKS